ncbi:MAG: DUF1553 domain-containing protein [Verrucomicrobia bacterium]|nr:DUF1553 domain-containing protein [Verrucomicrobiota bacterium]
MEPEKTAPPRRHFGLLPASIAVERGSLSLDCADPSISIPRRTVTTTPLQALAMLNNEFMTRAAEAFARRLTREAGDDPIAQIRKSYKLALLRDTTEPELASARRFIAEQGLSDFCLVLFNSNEFVHVD